MLGSQDFHRNTGNTIEPNIVTLQIGILLYAIYCIFCRGHEMLIVKSLNRRSSDRGPTVIKLVLAHNFGMSSLVLIQPFFVVNAYSSMSYKIIKKITNNSGRLTDKGLYLEYEAYSDRKIQLI